MKPRYLLMLTALGALIGCMNGTPSTGDGRAVLQNKLARSGDVVRVASFTKTNGQRMNMWGVDVYIMEDDAVITYPNGSNMECADTSEMANNGMGV